MVEVIYGVSGDVREELGNSTETEHSSTLLLMARTRATRVVNSFLEKAFPSQIPFGSTGDVPVLITEIVNELSVFYVLRAKHPGPAPLTKEVKQEYWDKPLKMLQDILEEKIKIPELTASEPSRILSNRGDKSTIFDIDPDTGWVVDPDLQQEVEDQRDA